MWSENAWTTSFRAGRNSISGSATSKARATALARSTTLYGVSAPTLKTSFAAPGTSMQRAIRGATSSICVNARVCRPSPKTVIGLPAMTWFMKIPITFRYGSARFWSSP